jgi:hypothetical protein
MLSIAVCSPSHPYNQLHSARKSPFLVGTVTFFARKTHSFAFTDALSKALSGLPPRGMAFVEFCSVKRDKVISPLGAFRAA